MIFLQEHWLSSYQATSKLKSDFKEYRFHTTSSDTFTPPEDILRQTGPTWHGTAVGWHFSLSNVTPIEVTSQRFCGIKVKTNELEILAFSIYLPTSGKDYEYLEEISLLIHTLKENSSPSSLIILGMDANVSDHSTDRRKKAFNQLKETFGLHTILPGSDATFHHNNGVSESQIDHILVNNRNLVTFLEQKCKMNNSENLSSHDALIASVKSIDIATKEDSVDVDTYEDFKPRKIIWDQNYNYENMSAEKIGNILSSYSSPEHLPALAEILSNTLVLCASKCLKSKEIKTSHKKKTPYFPPDVRQAFKNHRQICKQWRLAGRPMSPHHPAKAAKISSQRFIQKLRHENRDAETRAFNNDLMNTYHSNISQVYSKLNKFSQNTSQAAISEIETLKGTFQGNEVLEGFRVNSEYLCSEKPNNFENDFLKQCETDLLIINDIIISESKNIPPITIEKLQEIVFRKLKTNKACDNYQLTPEHLKYAGKETLEHLCTYINRVLKNLEYFSAPEFKISLASVIYKGKNKPENHHKSYRLVRVGPLIGRIIDEYVRPLANFLSQENQSINQYGFSENLNYLQGALQRHEAQKYCIDNKKTFFGCSLDGDSAFEVVNRKIQLRELYCAGETGQFGHYNQASYENTLTRIKMNQKVSKPFSETLGVGQGKIRSSDHYKIYIDPILKTLDEAKLGLQIGPINVGVSGVADDLYLISDDKIKLQAELDLCQDYGRKYRISYGANKTVISVVGSKADTEYYKDIKPWTMDGLPVSVSEDNEHLGLIVSNVSEEEKNVDVKLKKCRGALYKLLGPALSAKCQLNPSLKVHLFRTYIAPIGRSGLSAMTLRKEHLEPLNIFHRKVLRGILGLSDRAPVPALYFLTGELPFEASIHRDMFGLFHNVWSNKQTKLHSIIKYLLHHSPTNSHTWARHIRNMAFTYNIEDPNTAMKNSPPSKKDYASYVATKITVYHEKEIRIQAAKNSKMKFLNVNLKGLTGQMHPNLKHIITTRDVQKARCHTKFLCDDLYTYEKKAKYQGGSPLCRLCTEQSTENENNIHIIATCEAYFEIRNDIKEKIIHVCNEATPAFNIDLIMKEKTLFTQFVLDCTSMNLPQRIIPESDLFISVLKLSRDLCFGITKLRSEKLKMLQLN